MTAISSVTKRVSQHTGVRQFAKFCLIGAASTVVDVGLFSLFHFHFHIQMIEARTFSVSIAVINGYIWNSLWTFRGLGSDARHVQFMKFVAINIVGLALNLLIMQGVFFMTTGHLPRKGEVDKLHTYIALAVAISLVSIWNFTANKLWTFSGDGKRKPDIVQ